jgi:hypothetical protein
MIFWLYGPPGVGKSTIATATRGYDLESTRLGTPERTQLLKEILTAGKQYDYNIAVGTADERVDQLRAITLKWGVPSRHVLLLPERPVYYARRGARDKAHPSKSRQPDYYDLFESGRHNYDLTWREWLPNLTDHGFPH